MCLDSGINPVCPLYFTPLARIIHETPVLSQDLIRPERTDSGAFTPDEVNSPGFIGPERADSGAFTPDEVLHWGWTRSF